MRITLGLLIAALLASCQATGDRRGELAARVATHGLASAEAKMVEAVQFDQAARALFKALRNTPDWGPEHPAWPRYYGEFRAEYEAFVARHAVGMAADLRSALLQGMSEPELEEVAAFQGDPRVANILTQSRQRGLDVAGILRMMAMARNPQLYSQAEHEALKREMVELRAREAEILRLKPAMEKDMEELTKAMQQPAMLKFQKILRETLQVSLQRAMADAAFPAALAQFLRSWGARLP